MRVTRRKRAPAKGYTRGNRFADFNEMTPETRPVDVNKASTTGKYAKLPQTQITIKTSSEVKIEGTGSPMDHIRAQNMVRGKKNMAPKEIYKGWQEDYNKFR